MKSGICGQEVRELMYYTCVCCIVKDEEAYLREWVAWHLALGFEHSILYDNNSKKPVRDVPVDYQTIFFATHSVCGSD